MTDKNGDNFAGGADRADPLHEFDRGKAATVPDYNSGLGDEDHGSLTDGYGRIELDANNTRIRVFWHKLKGRLRN